jgi:hypothetical protein
MRRDKSTLARAAFATVLGVLSVPLVGSTEARAAPPVPVDHIRRCLAPSRLLFSRPICNRS